VKKMGLKEKGFLGPIGDDLPSLIPLLFALVMFFYVFTFSWNVFDKRNSGFGDALTILDLSGKIRGDNYLTGFGQFAERCFEAKTVKRVSFLAGLLPLKTGPGQDFKGIDVETMRQDFFSSAAGKFECTNTDSPPDVANTSLIVRFFPIAMEFKDEARNMFYVKPMLLVVAAWK